MTSNKFALNGDSMALFLLRVLATGVFGGSPDNLIDKLVRNIREKDEFVLTEILGVILADGRSMKITENVILGQYDGSRSIHLFFNLCTDRIQLLPALAANGPQVDHIFPQSLLKTVKDINPESGKRNILHYRAEQRDQLANCMLLTADENGFTGKCDTSPAEWFAPARFKSPDEHARYLDLRT